MNRQFNLYVSDLAPSTKLPENTEEDYVRCRDVTGPFMMALGSGGKMQKNRRLK
jgi:hypothetical protein